MDTNPVLRSVRLAAAMLTLALMTSTSAAEAPVDDAPAPNGRHQHLQDLLWLHSPDYGLVSGPAAAAAPPAATATHSDP